MLGNINIATTEGDVVKFESAVIVQHRNHLDIRSAIDISSMADFVLLIFVKKRGSVYGLTTVCTE